ncbi:MAG: hypothetical protein U5Q44_11990 [Dehalococcoidia bacterium]|nr:hypothetical protein [Dehalococcoidia bacterium]
MYVGSIPMHVTESNDNNNDCNNGTADTVQVVEELDVEQDPLKVTKTGKGSYVESHYWNVTKALDDDDEANKSAGAGETVTFDFNIGVTRDTSYENISASGTITVTNPPGNAENASLSGVSDDAAGTTITGCDGAGTADGDDWQFDPALELAPGGSVTCDWEYEQDSAQIPPSGFQNTATAHVLQVRPSKASRARTMSPSPAAPIPAPRPSWTWSTSSAPARRPRARSLLQQVSGDATVALRCRCHLPRPG